jgi:membrane-bound lytic murein transglycosylase B
VRIRGSTGTDPALASPRDPARGRLARITRKPAIGVAVITPLMLAAAVAASGPDNTPKPSRQVDAGPLAVASPIDQDMTGPTVVAVAKPPSSFHIAAATVSAPPPATVVSAPGALRIPAIALSAYRSAEGIMARTDPGCGVSWNLLAGIGRIESGHANNGATDVRGNASSPIYGPTLDGTLPGNEIIVANSQLGRVTYARAMGPMQFLPGTWSRYASDGDGDGKADPQNVYDASLAAARYLCSGGLNLRDPAQVMTAILRYNNSVAYARNVLGWAGGYTTGVIPINLPAITGPIPPMADARFDVNAHMDASPEGLGPGLPASDPLAQMPLFSLGQSDVANQLPVPPGPADAVTPGQFNAPCSIFCIGESAPSPMAPPAPWAAPPPWGPPAPGLPAAVGPAPGPVAEAPPPQPAPVEMFPAPAPPPPMFGAPPPPPWESAAPPPVGQLPGPAA